MSGQAISHAEEIDVSDNGQATRLRQEAVAAGRDQVPTDDLCAQAVAEIETAVRTVPARSLRPLVERIGRAYSWGMRRLTRLEQEAVRNALERNRS